MLNLSGTTSFGDQPNRKHHYGTWTIAIVLVFVAVFAFHGQQFLDDSKHKNATVDTNEKPDADSEAKSAAASALAAAVDVRMVTPGGGGVLVMVPYGPCGTISRIGQEYVWDGDQVGQNIFDTKYEAIASAASDCERVYLDMKTYREKLRRMTTNAP